MSPTDRTLVDEILERISDRLDLFRTELSAEIAAARLEQAHGDATLRQADVVTRERLDAVQIDQGRLAGKIETVESDVNRALSQHRAEILEAVQTGIEQISHASVVARAESDRQVEQLRDQLGKAAEEAAAGRRRIHTTIGPIVAGWTDDQDRALPTRVSALERIFDRLRWTIAGAAGAGGLGGVGLGAAIANIFDLGA